jgi:hypothetical protein
LNYWPFKKAAQKMLERLLGILRFNAGVPIKQSGNLVDRSQKDLSGVLRPGIKRRNDGLPDKVDRERF